MAKIRPNPKSRTADIVVQHLENEVLVYDLKTNRAYCLNETAAAVWQKCDGQKAIEEIVAELRNDINPSIDREFVFLALEQLRKDHLLENESQIPKLDSASRREMIRNVGLASFVALPLVSSLIAPSAANAQSGCPDRNNNAGSAANGCDCAGANDCSSNCCGFSAAVGNTCVTNGSVADSNSCRAACECTSGCCGVGFACVPDDAGLTGAACRVNCDCVNSCSAGVCT